MISKWIMVFLVFCASLCLPVPPCASLCLLVPLKWLKREYLNDHINPFSRMIRSSQDSSIAPFTSRSFMRSWTFVKRISTNATFTSICLPLSLKAKVLWKAWSHNWNEKFAYHEASTETLVVTGIRRSWISISPHRSSACRLSHPATSIRQTNDKLQKKPIQLLFLWKMM